MRKWLSLLTALLLLTASALASEPANPADPAMIAALLPGYTLVEGIDDSTELRLLMRNAENELVFIFQFHSFNIPHPDAEADGSAVKMVFAVVQG